VNKIKTKNIDLAIVTNEPFPIGMAATNRIISYASIIANNKKVKVYITKPTEKINTQFNYNASGEHKKIVYEYTSRRVIWPEEKSKLFKFKIIFYGYLNLIIALLKQKPKTIIIYTSNISTRLLLIILKPFLRYRLIIEENEYPKVLKRTNNKVLLKINFLSYKKCDGMLVITEELESYYKSMKSKDVHVLPMTVDTSRFKKMEGNVIETNYFIYVGGGGGFKRDGVFDIVKGFAIFQKNYPEYNLLLIGPYNPKDENIQAIIQFIDNNNLSGNITLTGPKSTNEIPSYLSHAKGIIMAPPKNFVSGGFPTKLGEFLMSGTPVITTAVSDIPKYLNSSNSYIIKKNNPQGIAISMEKIIQDEVQADKIGLKGKETAFIHFNAETYLNDLMTFLKI